MKYRGLYLFVFAVALAALSAGIIAGSLRRASRDTGLPEVQPRRIVSLTPSLTEAVFVLGAGDRLVGRTRFCDYPEEALQVEVVAGYTDIDVEKVLLLHPDLVAVSPAPGNRDAVTRIVEAGVRVEVLELRTMEEVFSAIVRLGEILGRRKRADEMVRELGETLGRVRERAASAPEVSCLLVVDHDPTVLAAPGSFPHELLEAAGGRNLVEEADRAYVQADVEWLSAHPPALLLDLSAAHGGEGPSDSELTRRYDNVPGWKGVVRIVPLRDDSVTVPGPRLGQALRLLFVVLHGNGDAFPD